MFWLHTYSSGTSAALWISWSDAFFEKESLNPQYYLRLSKKINASVLQNLQGKMMFWNNDPIKWKMQLMFLTGIREQVLVIVNFEQMVGLIKLLLLVLQDLAWMRNYSDNTSYLPTHQLNRFVYLQRKWIVYYLSTGSIIINTPPN
jgi:hypothetical protein